MKRQDKNLNELLDKKRQPNEQKKRFLLRQYQDTEALEEIKEYETDFGEQRGEDDR